ncbi:hypothetical protein C8J56DRAFT_1086552 [Mycena floridula]|nr:hypothetical protein C8J56DRAFT_1086552 [Mycena floridula]
MVLEPIAKSITCLEASHSTVADVFLFWLAIAAAYNDLLDNNTAKLPVEVAERIRRLVNYRFDQSIHYGPSDMFVAGFFLDPRYRASKVLKDVAPINPLEVPTVRIRSSASNIPAAVVAPDPSGTLRRIAKFLFGMLKSIYHDQENTIDGLSAGEATIQLRQQIDSYAAGKWPFNEPPSEDSQKTVFSWWKRLTKNPDAKVLATLAVKLFAMTPNSMADERTASVFTWLNSARRSSQNFSTLVRTAQLRAHYLKGSSKKKPKNRPTVKFRDMTKTLRVDSDDDSEFEPPSDTDTDDSDYSEYDSEEEELTGDDATPSDEVLEVMPGDHISSQDIPVDMTVRELIDVLVTTPTLPPRRPVAAQDVEMTLTVEAEVVWDYEI